MLFPDAWPLNSPHRWLYMVVAIPTPTCSPQVLGLSHVCTPMFTHAHKPYVHKVLPRRRAPAHDRDGTHTESLEVSVYPYCGTFYPKVLEARSPPWSLLYVKTVWRLSA